MIETSTDVTPIDCPYRNSMPSNADTFTRPTMMDSDQGKHC
jgi:hypothetical protein